MADNKVDYDQYMVTSDEFVLFDEDGNELAKRKMVQHLKVYLDEVDPERKKNYRIKSSVASWDFVITKDTTAEDWRRYADDCLMLLD